MLSILVSSNDLRRLCISLISRKIKITLITFSSCFFIGVREANTLIFVLFEEVIISERFEKDSAFIRDLVI